MAQMKGLSLAFYRFYISQSSYFLNYLL